MVNSLEMALPSGKPPPQNPNAPKPKINRILVDDQGQVFRWNDESIPEGTPPRRNWRRITIHGSRSQVCGQRRRTWWIIRSMIKVLDGKALQQLDITKVGLATQ